MLEPRMKNPGRVLPGAVQAIQSLIAVTQKSGLDPKVSHLAHLRASQINGCAFCVDIGVKQAKQDGESDERLHAVSAWREMPYFSEPERAAMALAEAMTRLPDRGDPVSDRVWNDAAKHFDEKQLAGLVLWIATTNLFNRINVTVHQPPGQPF